MDARKPTGRTATELAGFFADLPQDQELQFLRATLDEAEEGVGEIDRLAAAWTEGDIGALEQTMVTDMKRKEEALRKAHAAGAGDGAPARCKASDDVLDFPMSL